MFYFSSQRVVSHFSRAVFFELFPITEHMEEVRERVQISASGHTDTDQLGTDFFRFRWRSDPILSVPNETESATGLKSLSRQLIKVIKNIWQLK